MPLPIEDYALIGDCETAGLVGKNGSIDWLCWPRFDSDACFAALLGTPEHGRWLIGPVSPAERPFRRYWGDSLILETCFETVEGAFPAPRLHASEDRSVEFGPHRHRPTRQSRDGDGAQHSLRLRAPRPLGTIAGGRHTSLRSLARTRRSSAPPSRFAAKTQDRWRVHRRRGRDASLHAHLRSLACPTARPG